MGFKQEQFINIKLPSANEPRGAAPGPARPSRPSRQLSIYSPPPPPGPPTSQATALPLIAPLLSTPIPLGYPPSLEQPTSVLARAPYVPPSISPCRDIPPMSPLGHPTSHHPSWAPASLPVKDSASLPARAPCSPPSFRYPPSLPSRSPHNTYQPPPSACRTPSFPQTGGTPHPSARRRSAPRAAEGAEPQHQAPRFWGPGGTWSRRGDAGWGGQAARVPTSRSQEAGTHPSWTYLEEPITHMNF